MRAHSSSRKRHRGAAVAGLIGAGLLLAVAGCGTSPTTEGTAIGSPPVGTASFPASPSPHVSMAAAVGQDCAMFPAQGSGSRGSMTGEKALAAASANPRLSAFVAAVRAAGLETVLNSRTGYTLMIPDNAAFGALSSSDVARMHNLGYLTRLAKYHVASARVTPAQFGAGASVPTLEGGTLKLARSGSAYTVNGATVLCGNITTSDATVYVINGVLVPPG